MSKQKFNIGNFSDVGRVRKANEDYFGAYSGKFGQLVIVCDGMGGYKGGSVASRIVVETIREHFEKLPDNFDPDNELRLSLLIANENIKKASQSDPELQKMGSTAVVLLILNDVAHYAYIGDSRIYLIRNQEIVQISKDHSFVQQLIDNGIIKSDKAKDHPQKNVITKALGADSNHIPDIGKPFEIYKGDKFLLCTDGLINYVEDNELLNVCVKNDPQTACKILVDMANNRGGSDNITVQILEVLEGKKLPLDYTINKYKKTFNKSFDKAKSNLKLAILFIVILAGAYIFMTKNVTNTQDPTNKNKQTNVDSTHKKNKSTNDTLKQDKTKDTVNKVNKINIEVKIENQSVENKLNAKDKQNEKDKSNNPKVENKKSEPEKKDIKGNSKKVDTTKNKK